MVPTDSPLVIIQSQAEFCPSTKGLVAMPSALKSPKPAFRASSQAVSVEAGDQQEEEELVTMRSALMSPGPALNAPYRAVSFVPNDLQEGEEAPEGSLAMPSALISPKPAFNAPHRAVSFGTWDQQEEEQVPSDSLAMPSALMSPRPALNAPRGVSFDANDLQEGEEAPEGSLAVPRARKHPRLPPLTVQPSRRSVSFRIKDQLEEEEKPPEGQLRFQLDNGDVFQDGDALRAFTSIAQVGPCAKEITALSLVTMTVIDHCDDKHRLILQLYSHEAFTLPTHLYQDC